MLRKIRRAWHSARALQHFARKNPGAALKSVEAMRAISPLSAAERMWTFYPLAMAGRFDEAFDILDEVSRETDGLEDDNSRFVNLCVRAARASSNGQSSLHDHLILQAKRLSPKSSVRMWSQLDRRAER
jgi:hypothetical protein